MTPYQTIIRRFAVILLTGLLLESCAVQEQGRTNGEVEVAEELDQTISVTTLNQAEVYQGTPSDDRQRLIADLLFDGLQALDADRLLTPIDDNAHARFKRALAYDPDNEIARQGLIDIVARYVELALEASRQGLFPDAELLLDRAQFVDEDHPAIAQARIYLQEEMNSGDLFFNLDGREFARRSEAAQERLSDIARQAEKLDAFFLITAPNDGQARWMFSIMREAVEGYRLRGNIELTSKTSIRLRIPDN